MDWAMSWACRRGEGTEEGQLLETGRPTGLDREGGPGWAPRSCREMWPRSLWGEPFCCWAPCLPPPELP